MRILIVDDDAAFRNSLKSDLTQMGHEVSAAVGLESALDAVLQTAFRAAIVDAHLPYGETRRLITMLQSCGTSVLLLAEQDSTTGLAHPTGYASVCTLMKPVGVVELERSLYRLLECC
ncbi:hypothetical protein ASD55_07500 [Rhodanobacter sp. Root561]|uniref:response regulator transcription factor n=1 Tax=Rhodanobacter sp. Root561 TaxID=1736560 RepID=UPI0006FA539F|nr:response regulator transcription factor [Rhodanobacter sp. Root561]KQZ77700.1 hypothetical protein ASD55_07500 [Rhodanobacter sp. Root561]